MLVALAPCVALLLLDRPPFDVAGNATYLRYREIWGGNPNEVFSHFLELVLMTGNAVALGGQLVLEACFRNRETDLEKQPIYLKASTIVGLGASGLLAAWLDDTYGEGTVVLVYPLGFLPVLLACRRLLRRLAARYDWRLLAVTVIAVVSVLAHAALQYAYEPSVTGGPNNLFLPLWLAALAFLWREARVRRQRTGQVTSGGAAA
jgi:peptidoglycan/LPS O-acetylase OafA/YrhL